MRYEDRLAAHAATVTDWRHHNILGASLVTEPVLIFLTVSLSVRRMNVVNVSAAQTSDRKKSTGLYVSRPVQKEYEEDLWVG